jgi:hypothetical protein
LLFRAALETGRRLLSLKHEKRLNNVSVMAIKHYKKPSPKQAVFVRGAPITFEKVNIEVGVYKTDDENIQREFAALQQRGVGGIFDITAEEYESIKKKQTSSPGSYRDELGKSFSQPRTAPPNDLVYRAEDNAPVPAAMPLPGSPAVPDSTVQPSKKPLPRRRQQPE